MEAPSCLPEAHVSKSVDRRVSSLTHKHRVAHLLFKSGVGRPEFGAFILKVDDVGILQGALSKWDIRAKRAAYRFLQPQHDLLEHVLDTEALGRLRSHGGR